MSIKANQVLTNRFHITIWSKAVSDATERLERIERSISNLEKLVMKLFEKLENEDRYMDIKEAANHLGKGYGWLFANKHNIGCGRIGGEWKFKKSRIDAYYEEGFYKNK